MFDFDRLRNPIRIGDICESSIYGKKLKDCTRQELYLFILHQEDKYKELRCETTALEIKNISEYQPKTLLGVILKHYKIGRWA